MLSLAVVSNAELCLCTSCGILTRLLRPCGTAEDVLGDLGVRQAIKAMPKNVKL